MKRHLLRACLVAGCVLLLATPGRAAPLTAELTSDDLAPEPLPAGLVAETLVADTGDIVPAIVAAPDGRIFYTVKGGPVYGETYTGQVRILANGQLRETPFLEAPVSGGPELGMIGIALDPAFLQNRYVYLYMVVPPDIAGDDVHHSRIVRYTEDPVTQTAIPNSATTLLDIPLDPNADRHVGGSLRFGPDGKLYVSVGDNFRRPNNAQTLANPYGKIHRFNPDGSVPDDNPFVGQPDTTPSIWMYGLRNPFDFAFDPQSDTLFLTENGAQCDDEVNRGQPGANYGWPGSFDMEQQECLPTPDDAIAPLFRHLQAVGIAGMDFYSGPMSAWDGGMFWCGSTTGTLYHGTLNAERTELAQVTEVQDIPFCHIDAAPGPDGALYIVGGDLTISRIRPTAALTSSVTGIAEALPAGETLSLALPLAGDTDAPWTATVDDPRGLVELANPTGTPGSELQLTLNAPLESGRYYASLIVNAPDSTGLVLPITLDVSPATPDSWNWLMLGAVLAVLALLGGLLLRSRQRAQAAGS